MATLLEQATQARTGEFQRRVGQAMVKQAVSVSYETKPDYRRGNYAAQVLNNANYFIPFFSYAVAAQVNKVEVKDEEIIAAMAYVWNAFASAFDKKEAVVDTNTPKAIPPEPEPKKVVEPEPEPEEETQEEQPKPWYKKLFGG